MSEKGSISLVLGQIQSEVHRAPFLLAKLLPWEEKEKEKKEEEKKEKKEEEKKEEEEEDPRKRTSVIRKGVSQHSSRLVIIVSQRQGGFLGNKISSFDLLR